MPLLTNQKSESMSLTDLLEGKQVVAVGCNQWGDTGKGKIVDAIAAEWADVVVRSTGGANAGHTIVVDDEEFISHLSPSGVLNPNILNLITRGVALHPGTLIEELDLLDKRGKVYQLGISHRTHLLLPQHIVMDFLSELYSPDAIGTTKRGIGPCYTDAVARTGLTMNDLLNKDVFYRNLKRNLRDKIRLLKTFDSERVKAIFQHERLGNGIFYDEKNVFDIDAIMTVYLKQGERLGHMITDTEETVQSMLSLGKKVLLEGAQGLLLSVLYGIRRHVTSSDPSRHGMAQGCDLETSQIDLFLGLVNAFYMKRVGDGVFPTEMGGNRSEAYCRREFVGPENKIPLNADFEAGKWGELTVNEEHPFFQGIAVRRAGNEYGATTGRPRRCGWLDLPLLRYAMSINGPNIVLSKVDVLSDCDEIKICKGYRFSGAYMRGQIGFGEGAQFETAVPDTNILQGCEPIYDTFPGWKQDISGIRNYEDLPDAFKDIVRYIKKETGANIKLISNGPSREQLIIL